MEFLQAVSEWPGAIVLRRFQLAYLLVNAAHIISIGLLFGAIVTLDLRILGLFKQYPMNVLGPPLSRVAAAGVALAVVTGLMLFSVRPIAYVQNTAFLIKIWVIGLGVVNALLLTSNRYWRRALLQGKTHWKLRLPALLSLVFWVSAIIAGRWTGFV
jgi:amino acid transporter